MKAGWMYTLPHTTLNADFEGGYGGRTRNGDLDYKEKRLTDGATFGEGDYYSRDDYDLHETYFQGTIGFDHKFDDKGHQLMGSFYLKYGGNAMEYFQSDLFNKNNEREKGHRAWEDEHRWTVRVTWTIFILTARRDGSKAVTNISLIWKTATTRCISGTR